MARRETNPHFSGPQQLQHEGHLQPPLAFVPHQEHHGQPPPHGGAPVQQEDLHPHFPLRPHPQEDHFPLHPRQQEDHFPLHPYQQEDHFPLRPHQQGVYVPPPISKAPRREKRGQPLPEGRRKQQEGQPHPASKQKVKIREPSSAKPSLVSPMAPPLDHPLESRQQLQEPHKKTQGGDEPHKKKQDGSPYRQGMLLPPPKKSNPLTWCGAVFCIIFWLTIIIGGLIVLIVYLVFRPQSPHFEVSSVTLNAAYLDFGYLLNADITILANFTNPNKKVHVDFSSVTIYLYYGSTLIASQYVEPFSAARVQSRFAYIHMVTSQVQLPLGESQRLLKQMESNGVLFQVRGVFRARSKLGSILRYSYNLYGLCNLMVTRPPDGILLKRKCRTKR